MKIGDIVIVKHNNSKVQYEIDKLTDSVVSLQNILKPRHKLVVPLNIFNKKTDVYIVKSKNN